MGLWEVLGWYHVLLMGALQTMPKMDNSTSFITIYGKINCVNMPNIYTSVIYFTQFYLYIVYQ